MSILTSRKVGFPYTLCMGEESAATTMARRELFPTPKRTGCRVSQKGFTLVELMVVIAIIALLAILTMPAAMKALAAGRDVACKANLRSIGPAFFQYTGDHGVHPIAWAGQGTPHYPTGRPWYEARWEYQLLPYMKGMDEKVKFMGVADRLRAMSEGAFRCPEFPYGKSVTYADGGKSAADQMRISYAMNFWLSGTMKGTQLDDLTYNRAAWAPSMVPHPKKMLILVDVVNSPMMHVKSRFEPSYLPDRVDYRHNARANLLYYDGAVRGFSTTEGAKLALDPDFKYVPESAVYLSRLER